MCIEYQANKQALKLLMKHGKKHSLCFMKHWMEVIYFIGNKERIEFWEQVNLIIKNFNYETASN